MMPSKQGFSEPNGSTDYEKYIRTEELLALQKKALVCHDELFFQVVHQVEELWMKLVLHDLDRADESMKTNQFWSAHSALSRTYSLLGLMSRQFELLNFMSPTEYHKVRTQLGKGSGQESPGFSRILNRAPKLWPAFANILAEKRVTLFELHDSPEENPDVFQLAEDLFGLDEAFLNFRHLHLQLVKRIIGGDVPSLKGVHAEKYLSHGLSQYFFPELWGVRNEISRSRGIPIGNVR